MMVWSGKRSRILWVIPALLLVLAAAGPSAFGKTWGPATAIKPGFDKPSELDRIFKDLAKAENEPLSRVIADKLWLTWMMAPDEESAELLNRALRARGGYSFDRALGFLDQLIERHPDYPEAWNQRSYIHFLKENYPQSVKDCARALELEPRHIGCLSGMARIFIRHFKDYERGRFMLEQAMDLHPWIYERVLLKELPKP